jgi:small subunit ribosomal protein S8e
MGDKTVLTARTSGGRLKARVLREANANLSDRSGKVVRAKILSVTENPAGVDLRRGGIMTKGAIIQTPMGRARITSRPGQSGTIDAVLIEGT